MVTGGEQWDGPTTCPRTGPSPIHTCSGLRAPGPGGRWLCSSWPACFVKENTAAALLQWMGPKIAACPGKHQWCCWARGAWPPLPPALDNQGNPYQSSSYACLSGEVRTWRRVSHSAQDTDLVPLRPAAPASRNLGSKVPTRPQGTSCTCPPSLELPGLLCTSVH